MPIVHGEKKRKEKKENTALTRLSIYTAHKERKGKKPPKVYEYNSVPPPGFLKQRKPHPPQTAQTHSSK